MTLDPRNSLPKLYDRRTDQQKIQLEAARLYDDLTREKVRAMSLTRTNDRLSEGIADILAAWTDAASQAKDDLTTLIEGEGREHPLYQHWLIDVKGVGPLLTGLLVAYIGDGAWFTTVSQLWKTAGLGFTGFCGNCKVTDDKGKTWPLQTQSTSCPECGSPVEQQAQRRRRGMRDTGFPPLKQVCGKIARQLIMAGGVYYDQYLVYKETVAGERPAQKDARARRLMIKLFLAHALQVWREALDLPVREPYSHQYLGHGKFIPPMRDPVNSKRRVA